MANSRTGSTQELGESRAQALQALFNSISPGTSSSQDDAELTPDQVRKISDKLGELLGDGATDGSGQKRNEKGELVNEEGLPIIDIVEPVSVIKTASASAPIFDDPDLLPPWALSSAEKARRHAERERILDVLEEEERLESERAEAAERERFKTELEKRKEAAKAELEAMKKARELQKRMGKALLRNVIDNKEREDRERARQEQEEQEGREKKRLKPKKSVSFADPPTEDHADDGCAEPSDLGDISLAKMQRKGKMTLLTKADMDQQPMKMNIVERHPSAGASRNATPVAREDRDSDDESEVNSVHESVLESEDDVAEHVHGLHSSPPLSEESDLEYDQEEPVEWEEEEFDFARHQREIALAYYEKRATVGSEALSAMRAHNHDESEWDQPEVPLDATLASAPPKPSASRFKTERMSSASSSTLASHSLGPSVLPSAQSSSLQQAVRMGKLEGSKLVGGDETDDDVEEEARAIFEMLKRGEMTNLGPGAPPIPEQDATNTVVGSPSTESEVIKPPKTAPRSKVSKFKLAFGQNQTASRPDFSSPGALPTPLSATERSSPKLTSPGNTPVHVPTPTSPPPRSKSNTTQGMPSSRPLAPPQVQAQMPSMIIESPSFRRPAILRTPSSTSSTSNTPTIIDSPSAQGSAQHLNPDPSFRSLNYPVIASSSFSAGQVGETPPNVDSREPSATKSVPERPSIVMAAEVKEKPSTPRSGTSSPRPPRSTDRKLSRFLSDRLYE